MRDAVLKVTLLALWRANYEVYGVRKLWKATLRDGHAAGRDQVGRLMRELGICGARRGRSVRTTRPDPAGTRAADLVKRQFAADGPNQLWVTDLTYVATWAGTVYVCFIVDVFSRMIVGWRVAANMRTGMVLDALEMARWSRGTHLEGLVCHSDAGSQGGFSRSSQHLQRGGVRWEPCGSDSGRSSSIEGRCRRRAGRRWHGERIESGSGRRSPVVRRPRTPERQQASHPPLRSDGSVTLAA